MLLLKTMPEYQLMIIFFLSQQPKSVVAAKSTVDINPGQIHKEQQITTNSCHNKYYFPHRLKHRCSAVQGVPRHRERCLPQWLLPETGLGSECSG